MHFMADMLQHKLTHEDDFTRVVFLLMTNVYTCSFASMEYYVDKDIKYNHLYKGYYTSVTSLNKYRTNLLNCNF